MAKLGKSTHALDLADLFGDQAGMPPAAWKMRDVVRSFGGLNITGPIAAAYTMARNDKMIRYDPTAGAFTITLLPAASYMLGTELVFKNLGTSATAMTIKGNAAETIDGANTLVVSASRAKTRLVTNGASWDVIG
jgi:hypothetical protein